MVHRNGKAAELRIVNWHVQELIPLKSFSLENHMCLFFLQIVFISSMGLSPLQSS